MGHRKCSILQVSGLKKKIALQITPCVYGLRPQIVIWRSAKLVRYSLKETCVSIFTKSYLTTSRPASDKLAKCYIKDAGEHQFCQDVWWDSFRISEHLRLLHFLDKTSWKKSWNHREGSPPHSPHLKAVTLRLTASRTANRCLSQEQNKSDPP